MILCSSFFEQLFTYIITVKKNIEQIDVFFNKLTEIEGDCISIPHHLESYVLVFKINVNTK